MEKLYDCTEDVNEHIENVRYWMRDFANQITARAKYHDASKLQPPEKDIFDVWTPKLKEFKFGSEEYNAALKQMGEGLLRHYKSNRHHPEHFTNGVEGMSLTDLIEMFCDWMAAAQAKKGPIDIDYLANRFGLAPQLVEIFVNTMNYTDHWNSIGGVPVIYFTPENKNREFQE